eukprot:1063404-Pelagomonas_calceolata.AAC.3
MGSKVQKHMCAPARAPILQQVASFKVIRRMIKRLAPENNALCPQRAFLCRQQKDTGKNNCQAVLRRKHQLHSTKRRSRLAFNLNPTRRNEWSVGCRQQHYNKHAPSQGVLHTLQH